jgi:hypothetical protein
MPLLDLFFAMLWFFLWVAWIWLVISVFIDIFRSHDLGGFAKAFWALFVLLVPFLGVFIYLIVRGEGMQERSAVASHDEAMRLYLSGMDGGSSDADELAKLAELHTAGKLDDAEYASAKATYLG